MLNVRQSFDEIGVVVDWIDACKERRLDNLLELYDDAAVVDCCDGGNFKGRSEVERYWRLKLAQAAGGAFGIDALLPEAEGVSLDYRDHDGKPVRMHFRFNAAGKIRHTVCAPIEQAA